jgi:hypothetical protein
LFELQVKVVTCNFFKKLARVNSIELDGEVQLEDVFAVL